MRNGAEGSLCSRRTGKGIVAVIDWGGNSARRFIGVQARRRKIGADLTADFFSQLKAGINSEKGGMDQVLT